MTALRAAVAALACGALTLAACGTAPEPVATPAASTPAASTPAASTPGSPTPAPAATPTPTPAPGSACALDPREASLEEKVGYLFLMGRDVTAGPIDDAYRKTMADNHIRAVVLLGNTRAGSAAVADIVAGLDPSGKVLVAADQEGGQVQRLRGPGFDAMPPATEQAAMSDAALRAAAEGWARQLGAAGVDMNLAPVADVVPADVGDANAPVAQLDRGYGSDPARVGDKAAAYTAGMRAGGQLTSVKHFPGLGAVTGNTDFSADVTDDRTTRDDPALASFAAVVAADVDSVMVATARYDRIDPDNPAAFSPVVIGDMIRGDLGFDGVVVSDDMGAAAQVADIAPGERAVRFLAAGGDLVINGDPALQDEMTRAVLRRARADAAFARALDGKVERVSALQERACGDQKSVER